MPFKCAGHHVIYQAVFILYTVLVKLRFEFFLVDIFKNVLKATIVLFQYGVLRREIKWPVL